MHPTVVAIVKVELVSSGASAMRLPGFQVFDVVEVVGEVFAFVDDRVRVDDDGLVVWVLRVCRGVVWAVTAASTAVVGWVHCAVGFLVEVRACISWFCGWVG